MLTNNDLFAKIDRIVDAAYLPLLYMLVGEGLLSDDQKRQIEALGLVVGRRPLVDLVYILVRNRPADGYPKDTTLSRLLDEASLQPLPILNDAQLATLNTSKSAIFHAIETVKDELKKKLRQRILEANRQYRQHVAVKRIESLSRVEEKKTELKDQLLKLVPIILLAAQNTFERSFTSVLTETVNDAALDSTTAESLLTGIPPRDLIVFKKVVNDDRLCQWCHRFYVDSDGSPMLFKLSELQANGSNFGKPKSEWKPTIGQTHDKCRCMLFHKKSLT